MRNNDSDPPPLHIALPLILQLWKQFQHLCINPELSKLWQSEELRAEIVRSTIMFQSVGFQRSGCAAHQNMQQPSRSN